MIGTSADIQAIRRVTRKQLTFSAILGRWPLVPILILQALVSLLTLHNTAFQDEALYLYAGQQILHQWMGGPVVLDPYAIYFSGYPYFYPVIGGVLDSIGGLTLARCFSLLCMMGVTVCIYAITKKLFSRNAAIFASAFYVGLGSVLFIGYLATYDALCLLLLALATVIAYKVSVNRNPWLAVWIGPLLLLAVAAKYAALLFTLPVLGILIVFSLEKQGWWRMLLRLAIVLVTTGIVGFVGYLGMDKNVLIGLSFTTTNRAAIIPRSPLELLIRVLQLGGIAYAVAILGIVLLFVSKRYRLLSLLLFASAWLVPAYHIYKHEFVSLDKHMAFSLFFIMPVVGFALTWLSGYARQRFSLSGYWLTGLAALLLVFTIGTQQASDIYASWANTNSLSYELHTQLRAGSGRYLVEDIEVSRYYAKDVSDSWQWSGISNFYYIKSVVAHFTGEQAYTEAIHDRYFDVVELSFNYQPGQARFVAQQMIQSKNYDLISKVKFQNSFGTGYYYLWRKAAVAGHGNFTSLTQVKI